MIKPAKIVLKKSKMNDTLTL